jgi:RimJ/RimL family protein N-acetyltransferase
MNDLSNWSGCARPERKSIEGRFVRLEPLVARHHGDDLYACSVLEDGPDRSRWLPDYPPQNREDLQPWLDHAESSADPMFFAVIDQHSGKVGGRQSLMRINEANGVIEIGHIYWSSQVARRAAATEAFFLFASYALDTLGYRRFEWKCDNANAPSKRSARRFGMTHEGVFRQAAVVKGRNRDTAWYSIIDSEWPTIRRRFELWLDPRNFDDHGEQIRKLESIGE